MCVSNCFYHLKGWAVALLTRSGFPRGCAFDGGVNLPLSLLKISPEKEPRGQSREGAQGRGRGNRLAPGFPTLNTSSTSVGFGCEWGFGFLGLKVSSESLVVVKRELPKCEGHLEEMPSHWTLTGVGVGRQRPWRAGRPGSPATAGRATFSHGRLSPPFTRPIPGDTCFLQKGCSSPCHKSS